MASRNMEPVPVSRPAAKVLRLASGENGRQVRKRDRAPELMRGKPSGADAPRPAPEGQTKAPTRLQLTRALARAMAKRERAEALLREARAEESAAFGPWSAGRSINRDEAREQLISTGFLPARKVWQS